MDKVTLGSLKDEPHPVRSLDVPMVAKLPDAAEQHCTCAGGGTEPDQEVDDHARQEAVDEDLERSLVEGRQNFEALCAVMNLMQPSPQKVRAMTPEMPPIENEG